MAKYYYFKTIKDGIKTRVVPVDNQILPDGTKIDTTKKVSCPTDIRDCYSLGTIFVGDTLILSKKGCYTTRNFRRLSKTLTEEVSEYEKLIGTTWIDPIDSRSIYEKITSDAKLSAPTSTGDGFFVSNDDWRLLVRNVQKHINTMIIGPSGVGKTSVVKELCSRLGLQLHTFDMGAMIDPMSSLLGVHRLEKGGSVFDYAKFTQVIQEPCVVLLDELSRAPLSSLNILFPCLDDRRCLSVDIAGSKDVRDIKIHPEVTFIATANVGAEYTGTNSMDRALVNRFFPLELGCIPSIEEEKVLIKRTGITADKSKLIVKIANNIRSLSNKQEVSTSLSIRETLMVAGLVNDGWNVGKAMEMIYLPLYEGTKMEGERSTIYKTISSY